LGCGQHDIVYYGALNIYLDEELLKVIEAWRCRKCGATRVGSRWPDLLSSTDGLLGILEPEDGRWIVVATRGSGSRQPDAFPMAARPGDTIHVEAPIPDEEELLVREDYSVVTLRGGYPPTSVMARLLDELIKGYIDLSTWPPVVFTLPR